MKRILPFLIILFFTTLSFAGQSAYTTAEMDAAFDMVYDWEDGSAAIDGAEISADTILKATFGDEDWGDLSVSSNSITLDADVVSTAEMADADHGDFSWSGGSGTIDADVIDKANFKDEDWGDMSVSTNSVTLDADVVAAAEMADADHGMVSWSSGAATVEDFALNADADAGDYDIKSLDKLEFYDTAVYIDGGADGYLDIEADTMIRLLGPTDLNDEDLTSIDKLEGYDTGVFADLGADGRIIIQADGAGTAFSTPDIDITGSVYFDDDIGLLLDKALQFGDANVFIESDDDGYLDLDADTGIRLNASVIASDIDGSGTFSANLFTPDAADGADIGSTSLYFSDAFFADGSILYFGDDQDVTLTHTADTGLTTNLNFTAASYGAAAVSDTELGYVDGVTSSIQTQLDARALETVVGTSLNADDLELNGAVLQTAAEIPHIDATHTWTAHQTMVSTRRSILTSAPTAPILLDEYTVDGATYDPSGSGLTVSHKVVLSRNTTELMPNTVDRDMSGASAWTDGTAGNAMGSYDETTGGKLTITANGVGDFVTLIEASAPTTIGKRYRFTYTLASIASTWTVMDEDAGQTIGTISANATAGYIDFTATTDGGIRLVAVAADSSGVFDDFSLNLLPYILDMDENGVKYANGMHSRTPISGSTTGFAAAFTGADLYGGVYVVTSDDGDLQLPLMGVGMNFSIVVKGAIECVAATNVDDGYLLDGVDTAEDNSVKSPGASGDIAVFQYYTADDWLITTNGWSTE